MLASKTGDFKSATANVVISDRLFLPNRTVLGRYATPEPDCLCQILGSKSGTAAIRRWFPIVGCDEMLLSKRTCISKMLGGFHVDNVLIKCLLLVMVLCVHVRSVTVHKRPHIKCCQDQASDYFNVSLQSLQTSVVLSKKLAPRLLLPRLYTDHCKTNCQFVQHAKQHKPFRHILCKES